MLAAWEIIILFSVATMKSLKGMSVLVLQCVMFIITL